jgi:hypothetical protein
MMLLENARMPRNQGRSDSPSNVNFPGLFGSNQTLISVQSTPLSIPQGEKGEAGY